MLFPMVGRLFPALPGKWSELETGAAKQGPEEAGDRFLNISGAA